MTPEDHGQAITTVPVQGTRGASIPWDVHVCAWQVYAACGHRDQSAARIAKRGGFSWGELAMLLAERRVFTRNSWEPLTDNERVRLAILREEGAER